MSLHSRVIPTAIVLASVLPLLVGGELQAQPGKGKGLGKGLYEIDLEVLGVQPNPTTVTIQPESGWPLTLRLTANEQELLGIGVPMVPPTFPHREKPGFLVFDDPDGCPSFVEGQNQDHFDTCDLEPPWPFDETWVEFTPGLTDWAGPDCGGRPEILTFEFPESEAEPGANTALSGIGPCVAEDDDYGYGPSTRLPGLVLLADTGPSIVTDDHFDRTGECRNLAGFVNSIAYELKDAQADGRTSITAHLNVPPLLFTPVALVDRSVTQGGFCEGGTLLRIDGGPITCIEEKINALDFLVNQMEVTARAFVVNVESAETAPDVLQDLTGTGYCSARDAELAGFEVLSREVTVRFRQIHELYFGFGFDFDGDKDVGPIVAPATPGSLTQPPR